MTIDEQLRSLTDFILIIGGSVVVAQGVGLLASLAERRHEKKDLASGILVVVCIVASGLVPFAIGVTGWRP